MLQNSKTPHLKTSLDVTTFEKYGYKFILNIITEERPRWEQVFRDVDGRQYSVEEVEWLDALVKECAKLKKPLEISKIVLEWEEVAGTNTCSYVHDVRFQDDEECQKGKPIGIYTVPDGPILGILIDSNGEEYTLLDPCIIQYVNDRIQLKPVFNVARKLTLKRHAVRSVQTPAEIIIACYPGFIIQNRMLRYQLKPNVPFASTPPLNTDAP